MDYRQSIIAYIQENARPVDKYDHQPRLYALTQQIGAEDLVYDDDVVFAAVWMHDVGVFVGHRPEDPEQLAKWDNVAYACEQAPSLLLELGFPQDKIPDVVEAIRTHQPAADPQSTEATLVRDADILEQLGAVAVVRAIGKIGRDTRYPTFHDVVPVLEKALSTLPGQLRLAKSRELAAPRIASLKNFLSALAQETQL